MVDAPDLDEEKDVVVPSLSGRRARRAERKAKAKEEKSARRRSFIHRLVRFYAYPTGHNIKYRKIQSVRFYRL